MYVYIYIYIYIYTKTTLFRCPIEVRKRLPGPPNPRNKSFARHYFRFAESESLLQDCPRLNGPLHQVGASPCVWTRLPIGVVSNKRVGSELGELGLDVYIYIYIYRERERKGLKFLEQKSWIRTG